MDELPLDVAPLVGNQAIEDAAIAFVTGPTRAIKANSLDDVPVAKRLVEVMDLARKYPCHHSS